MRCSRFFLTLCVLLLGGTALAQDERETVTTDRGLSLTIPAGWLVLGLEGESFTVMDPEAVVTMTFNFRDELEAQWDFRPETLDDLMHYLLQGAYVTESVLGELRVETRTTGSVLIQPFEGTYAAGAQIGIQFYDGEYAAVSVLLADTDFGRSAEMTAEALRMLDSVTFSPPALLYGPPRLLSEMPPDRIVFITGSSIRIPEGWQVKDDGQPVALRVELISPDGLSSIVVEETDDPARTVDSYRRDVGPLIASMAGDARFDPATHFDLFTLPSGQPVLTYDSRIHRAEDSLAPLVWYQLVATEFGVLQLTSVAPDADLLDDLYEPVLEIIQTYDVSGVQIDPGNCSVTC